uniref:CRIB domain-containing protein n=1 Tax=Periophthalmus magnuspinnatus TaxID=409849 RepID=A0A3B3ZL26_9GOBI
RETRRPHYIPKGPRRFKGDLTTDMISPPLGDFRHTMHVGRGGDVFGDTSFLSNHGGTANGNGGETDSITKEAKELSPPPPAVSPIIKNAISLPRLDVDLPNGTPTRQPSISLPAPLPPDPHRGSLTDPDQPLLPTRTSALLATEPKRTAYSDSLPSLTSLDFTFDLGPSLMSEVLGLIDGGHLEDHGHAWEEGSACGLTNEGSEMDSATISYVDSLLREDCGGGKSPNWDDEEAIEVNERVFSVKMPDVVMGSAERVKGGVGMESERFQSATDVLARHYGGSGVVKGHYKMDAHSDMFSKKKMSYTYIEDDDEIKV